MRKLRFNIHSDRGQTPNCCAQHCTFTLIRLYGRLGLCVHTYMHVPVHVPMSSMLPDSVFSGEYGQLCSSPALPQPSHEAARCYGTRAVACCCFCHRLALSMLVFALCLEAQIQPGPLQILGSSVLVTTTPENVSPCAFTFALGKMECF